MDDNVGRGPEPGPLLKLWGHEVRVAHDGPAALEAAAAAPPEVVLLDIGLPGMDGYEVAERLRARPESGGPVLVALTGYGQEEDRRRSREAGFDHHLVKPVDLDDLRSLLAHVGSASSPRAKVAGADPRHCAFSSFAPYTGSFGCAGWDPHTGRLSACGRGGSIRRGPRCSNGLTTGPGR